MGTFLQKVFTGKIFIAVILFLIDSNAVFCQQGVCDSSIILDYNQYNDAVANIAGIPYEGDLANPTSTFFSANELTGFIDSSHLYLFEYATQIWDSLAFGTANGSTGTYQINPYIPLSQASIYLDTLGVWGGIWGDTVEADGTMANDSLVFTLFPVYNGLPGAAVKTVVLNGYAGLRPFFTGGLASSVAIFPTPTLVPVGMGYQFTEGQGFGVSIEYISKDTSSHFMLCESWPDSCNSPSNNTAASLSCFPGASQFGVILGDASAPLGAAVSAQNNDSWGYQVNPLACSFTFAQNWGLLAEISVCANYGVEIQALPTTICGNSTVSLTANVYGTNSGNISYTWSASSGTFTDNTSQTTILQTNTNSNVTVTVSINDGSGDTTGTSIVLINCHPQPLAVNAGVNDTVCNGSFLILTPAVSGGVPPYYYSWQSSGSGLTCPACENPSVSISQNSVYSVTVTDANGDTAVSSVAYNISSTLSQLQLSLTNTTINCYGESDTTTATVNNGTSPYTINWGDGNTQTGNSPQTHNYSEAGQHIIVLSDAEGCVSSAYDSVPFGGIVVSLLQAVQPECPNVFTGSIIISASGGTPPYFYYWNNGSTSDSLLNVPAGSYSAWITDAGLCNAAFNYTLNPALDGNFYVYLNETDANCNLAGSIVANVYGGVPPYLYSWNTGAGASYINPNIAGNYSLTVTDSASCEAMGDIYLNDDCYSIISGTVFLDTNNNCIYDTGETGVSYIPLSLSSSTGNFYYGFTDYNGNYLLQVSDTGLFSIAVYNWWYGATCANITLCGNTSQTIYIPVLGDSSLNNNFAYASSSGFDLALHPGWTSANPGFQKEYWVMPYSQSNLPFIGEATVIFNYDSNLIYQYSLPPLPQVDLSTHTLTWLVDSVPYPWFDWDNVRFQNFFLVPAGLSLNYLLQSQFWIYPYTGDCDTSNNYFYFSETVTGSHDPNEKDVQPAGNLTEADSILTYTIHFQNTGTDSTHFIIVKDTLSPNLDPATVRNLASSYKYSDFNISGQGILTWTFNPYRLVDSITNAAGSKGFITFSVKKRNNLPLGATISNTASVYFDYNTPVVTNTVTDTISRVTGIFAVHNEPGITVKAFPNPFNNLTNIEVSGLNEKFDFQLYDLTGRLQRNISSISTSQFQLMRNDLAGGVYLYRILSGGKQVAYGKLVVD